MSSAVHKLLTKAEQKCAENFTTFIVRCKNLPTFGAELDWNLDRWDVTNYFDVRGNGQRKIGLLFTKFGRTPGVAGPRMEGRFAELAKGYVRYTASISKNKYPPYRDIQAFRGLYEAFLEVEGAEVMHIDANMFSRTVQILKEHISITSTMQAAERLQTISKFLAEEKLVLYPATNWKHGLPAIGALTQRVGKKFDEHREAKLPSDEVLKALATAFNVAERPRELIETSIYALLCSAPDRINELLALSVDCEINGSWDKSLSYGLRWKGAKGFPDHTKWIASAMADVARTAVERIKEQTKDARKIAKWYEEHPKSLYLPETLQYLRGRSQISVAEIRLLTGHKSDSSIGKFLAKCGVSPLSGRVCQRNKSDAVFRFSEVEQAILTLLPRGFPIFDKRSGLRFSEALMTVPYGLFRGGHPVWSCMFQSLRYDQVLQGLAGKGANNPSNPRVVSTLERLGIATADQNLFATPHQFRHWLNTVALKGGLSDWDMAQWSGRKDIRQNRAYDHESSEEILARLRNAVGNRARGKGEIVNLPRNLPISRQAFAELSIPNAHSTEIGFCVHDFSSSPCQLFMDCINCTESVCIKGDPKKTLRIHAMLEQARASLAKSQTALNLQDEGAQRWIEAHSLTIKRLQELYSLLIDPYLQEGAVIQLSNAGQYSIIDQAISDYLQCDRKTRLAYSGTGNAVQNDGAMDEED